MDPMDPETVIRHYAPTVYRLAAAQLHSRHDADDVLQEVFSVSYTHLTLPTILLV